MHKENTIPFYIYPDGIADSMGQDEFILVRNKLGSLDTKFVGDLVKGDYYCQRIPAPIPPRNGDDILKYIAKRGLSFNYLPDEDKHSSEFYKALEVTKKSVLGIKDDVICMVEYNENCIRTAIEPLMDMEEL
tara:strand:- start:293 stop:688 length:396 start_codon:yes stop_codon:yes gene_type:complete